MQKLQIVYKNVQKGACCMPQQDRHKDRLIPIEFEFYDQLEALPKKGRCSVVLLSCGNATVKINNQVRLLNSPCDRQSTQGVKAGMYRRG